MSPPLISIILPAFNCETFIEKALESLFSQTFTDFELLIINDGSTDQTENIILSFRDERIRYYKNDKNLGLIESLNKGISLSSGKYIARMDADDICFPDRLLHQKEFLDQYPGIAVVASTIIFIDYADRETGNWKLDRKTTTPAAIKKVMAIENCIAHPTVMARADILKLFLYKPYQKDIEDYDLWLRMLNRGYSIGKIKSPLLLYRVHDTSITVSVLKKNNFFFKHAAMKGRFFWNELKDGKIYFFTFRVLASAIIDFVKGIGKSLKRKLRS